jgi:hypothetical protein
MKRVPQTLVIILILGAVAVGSGYIGGWLAWNSPLARIYVNER